MQYDCLDGHVEGTPDPIPRFTVNDLIQLAKKHPRKEFVFMSTERTIGKLSAWRGNNSFPVVNWCWELKTGSVIWRELVASLKKTQFSYKGVEVKFTGDEIFYVSEHDRIDSFCVVGSRIDSTGRIELLTKIFHD